MAYKLSEVLRGHEMDVRGVCRSVFPSGGLVSVSRDRTVRVWKKDEFSKLFIEGQCFSGHQGFVAAVCTMSESDKYPHGLIITGGHDNLILVWSIESLEPVQTLSGHTGAVCALVAGNYGTILSGSWDKTAKVWLNGKCVMTLKGHEQAVWSVALISEQGMMLTASADKTIKMWKAGSCVKTFTGHTDCVRSLAVLTTTEFISSSNDNTIRKWSTSGECVQIFDGHTNFVYSLAAFPNQNDSFISTSEDRTVRIWKDGDCVQTITLPAQSVWCSTCLDNGDFAAGSSDGTVRIFTSDPERIASEDILKSMNTKILHSGTKSSNWLRYWMKQFQEEVSSHAIPAQVSSDGKLGDIKISDLPGPEALLRPGKTSGQNLLVKRGGTIEAYQWNDAEQKWDKIGEVVGAGGGSEGTSQTAGKKMFEGKEYDFVFDVDIQEGKPTLKLPYNLTDDPWFAAQQFLERNELSQLFLDQVAQFIINNTKSFTIGPQTNQSSYADPFTGGSRYVPGSSTSNETSDVVRGGADPFTGQGSYRPSYTAPMTVDNATSSTESRTNITSYFPEKSYLSFDQVKVDGLMGRLNEFNEKLDEDQKLLNEDITEIKSVLSSAVDKTKTASPLSHKQVDIVTRLIRWPTDICYPGLDVLRVLIRNYEISQHFVNNGDELVQYLLKVIGSEKTKNHDITTGIVFRIFSNLFSHEKGRLVMSKQREEIQQCINDNYKNTNKIVQIALCTILINYAVQFEKKVDLELKAPWINTVRSVMNHLVENEAKFRAMVALGTLIWGDQDSLEYAQTLDFLNLVNPLTSISNPQKVGACASQLKEALR